MAQRFLSPLLAILGVALALGAGAPTDTTAVATLPQQVLTGFTHAEHDELACYTCHENTAGHGTVTISTIEDCRACHHEPESAAPCARCHDAAEVPSEYFSVLRPVALGVGTTDAARSLGFPHDDHRDIDCARCHTEGTALAVSSDLDCASCHQDHHTVESDCAACHAPVHVAQHPVEEVHVTCSGAACHQDVPFESMPRTRAFCLGCHREMSQHEAPRACSDCHVLPAPRVSR